MESLANKIDFVVLYVDGNDVNWQNKKSQYVPQKNNDNSASRYREWGILKYWFRSVACYAPWVRKIHFVSDGQIPDFLNKDNAKLHFVDHKDYIPEEYLPVFNSTAIEVGIHKIPDLADNFVFFNDDIFINAPITPEYYFKKGLPVDMAGLTRSCKKNGNAMFSKLMLNNYEELNTYFNKNEVIVKNLTKWLNPFYGKTFLRTLPNLFRKSFDGIVNPHLSVPYSKTDFERVWEKCGQRLSETQSHRFRSESDLTHMLFRFWRMCSGDFFPEKSCGKYIPLDNFDSVLDACKIIERKKVPEICLNDTWSADGYESAAKKLQETFEKVFPEKCEFEV